MKLGLGGIGEAFQDENFRRYSLGSILSWTSYFVQAVAVSWTTGIDAFYELAGNHRAFGRGGEHRVDAAGRRHSGSVRPLSRHVAQLWLRLAASRGVDLAGVGRPAHDRAVGGARFSACAIHAFSIPARYGFLPRFVERKRLSSAISVAAVYTQLAIFAGPALAGWLILHFGVVAAYASNVIGYGVFFRFRGVLRRLPVMSNRPRRERASWRFSRRDRRIRAHHGILQLCWR